MNVEELKEAIQDRVLELGKNGEDFSRIDDLMILSEDRLASFANSIQEEEVDIEYDYPEGTRSGTIEKVVTLIHVGKDLSVKKIHVHYEESWEQDSLEIIQDIRERLIPRKFGCYLYTGSGGWDWIKIEEKKVHRCPVAEGDAEVIPPGKSRKSSREIEDIFAARRAANHVIWLILNKLYERLAANYPDNFDIQYAFACSFGSGRRTEFLEKMFDKFNDSLSELILYEEYMDNEDLENREKMRDYMGTGDRCRKSLIIPGDLSRGWLVNQKNILESVTWLGERIFKFCYHPPSGEFIFAGKPTHHKYIVLNYGSFDFDDYVRGIYFRDKNVVYLRMHKNLNYLKATRMMLWQRGLDWKIRVIWGDEAARELTEDLQGL